MERAWSCGHCSTCSFRRNARAAMRSAPDFAMRARVAPNASGCAFPALRVSAFGAYEGICGPQCSRSKTDGATSPRRWGARCAVRRSADALSCRFRRRRGAGASAASTALRWSRAMPPRSRGRRVVRCPEQRRATRSADDRGTQRLAAQRTLRLRPRLLVAGRRVTLVRRRLHDRRDAARLRRRGCGRRADASRMPSSPPRRKAGPRGASPPAELTPLDQLYLERAYELAARGTGNTAPNPPVGAVVVRDGRIPSAKDTITVPARRTRRRMRWRKPARTRAARRSTFRWNRARAAGRMPACAPALVEAGIARVVAGTARSESGQRRRGIAYLRERGIEVDVRGRSVRARPHRNFCAGGRAATRPYVALKMAMSLDGAIASRPGVRERIGSEAEERSTSATCASPTMR